MVEIKKIIDDKCLIEIEVDAVINKTSPICSPSLSSTRLRRAQSGRSD